MKPQEFVEFNWPKTVTRLKPELDALLKVTCEVSGLKRSQVARTLLQCWLKSIYGPESDGWTAEKMRNHFYSQPPEKQRVIKDGLQADFKTYTNKAGE